ncbi:uncharacterized protein SCHCODRAFT_02690207 [Schizophyllum commune H4-8]|uniref:uncharacterized protein n=1 Tax=Schizophyllum commune (strain H4-8 / FGSC 9210) TaxID=578458 RepID=UPI00215FC778|nr:uncharacterized protein SCHCODRAFT_02690207 [Schizophyllum commune H4-8]KAI5890215.1 hypothetical protein SCHCODRAFT_02690207 [Schizophyllum commune H4-8]
MDPSGRAALLQGAAALADLSRMRSGWAPSVEEAQEMRRHAEDLVPHLTEIEQEMGQADAEMRELKHALRLVGTRLKALKKAHAAIGAQSRISESMAAPIRRLPVEIMTEVFAHVLDNVGFYPTDIHRLSTICYAWRDILLSTPTLWARIKVGDRNSDVWYSPANAARNLRDHHAFVRAQLRWSAAAPLHIDVFVPAVIKKGSFTPVWKDICRESHRWKSATFWRYDLTYHEQFQLDHPHIHLPSLAALQPTCGLLMPNLRHLYIGNSSALAWAKPFPDWKLTTLELLCSSLTTLHVSGVTVSDQMQPPIATVTLPSLESLHLGGNAAQLVGSMLTVPCVRNLTLDALDSEFDGHVICQLVRRSSATISYLSLQPHNASDESIKHILWGLLTVTQLHLNVEFGWRALLQKEFFAYLTPSEENHDCLLPNLQQFSILASSTKDPGELPLNAVIEMLRDLRAKNIAVDGQLYPALVERSLTRNPGDDLFDDSDSDVDDDEYEFVELDTSEDDSDCDSCYSLDDEEREWLREPENVYKPPVK